MKSLIKYILESKLINEGGKAVDGTPMTQVQAKAVFDEVVENVLIKLGLENKGTDYQALGSFGKKKPDQTSGDIDIAVSIERIAGFLGISVDQVENAIVELCEREDLNFKYSKGIHVISFAWPIPDTDGLYGQVDIMPTDNMEFSNWIYHSPDFNKAESNYKGLYRNELMRVICSHVSRKVLSKNEQDEVMEYERHALDYSEGITKAIKSHIGKKGGRLKNPVTLKDTKSFVTKTPQDIIDIIFGKGYEAKDIMTFEKAYEIFMSEEFPWKDKREEIVDAYFRELVIRNAPIPAELYNDWTERIETLQAEHEAKLLARKK